MSRWMLCGLMSWVTMCSSVPARADDGEDKAVKFLEKLNGKVTRDEEVLDKPVIGLVLYNTQVTDAGLKVLARFTNLTALDLSSTQVTDEGLKELDVLQNLSVLILGKPSQSVAVKPDADR